MDKKLDKFYRYLSNISIKEKIICMLNWLIQEPIYLIITLIICVITLMAYQKYVNRSNTQVNQNGAGAEVVDNGPVSVVERAIVGNEGDRSIANGNELEIGTNDSYRMGENNRRSAVCSRISLTNRANSRGTIESSSRLETIFSREVMNQISSSHSLSNEQSKTSHLE
ncbi:uncharacterized protein LOC119662315 [Teleopsis dalmanni]|uniref:uncharacterized protein LOC119662315 n=1 Tax=Teleopsis dalmanni TaxID=139649 RepID=UPI0018CDD0FE|nr:uncharacterized protein LOC119662315 [Teleopsis dalmanni]